CRVCFNINCREVLVAISLSSTSSPMDEINMTPLIDVMLVLLVMFIITIPIQTQAMKLELPAKCAGCPVPRALKNKLVITNGGAILWNDTTISKPQLRYLLVQTAGM